MGNLALLGISLLTGLLLQRVRAFPADAHRGLNAFIIYISLPAITLRYLPELEPSWTWLYPAGMSWVVFLVGVGVFVSLGRWLGWDRQTVGCLVLVCGLGNTSFVGFPLIEAMYGTEGLRIAILCDQPGAFLVLSTLGIVAVGYFAAGRITGRAILGRVLAFPPFLAFLASLLLAPLSPWPDWITGPLETLGRTLTPLALVSVGLQLRLPRRDFPFPAFGIGLVYKLLLAPALIWGLYVGLLRQEGLAIEVSILEAAMAPMITPSIIAMEHGLNPPLASVLVGLGIPLSLLSVWGWYVGGL
ncbi:MAG: AEC family transporter [Bacteroidetes bacterium]|nr:MAG: AEC family transporter [Bacteroidota bacterium]